MNTAEKAALEIRSMDDLASGRSYVHRMGSLEKLAITIAYILTIMSFDKYDGTGLFLMLLFPVFWYQVALIPISTCFYKLRVVLPLVMAVGIFNPILNRQICLLIGNIPVSYGFLSMVTLMLKGVMSLMASFLLVATTPIDRLCRSLRQAHAPKLFTSLILLTYRYISVLLDETSVMMNAYMLRAPGQKGIAFKAWGSFLGQLILRSMDRSRELYESMELRGFDGEFYYCKGRAVPKGSRLAAVFTILLILFFRFADIPALISSVL